jgi:tetratricopeptide (TPR) repeat protein
MSAKKKARLPRAVAPASCRVRRSSGKPLINRKHWAVVAVLLVIICGSVYVIAVQFLGHPDYHAAEQTLARRDFQTASRHLRKYLHARPDDLDAQFLAAQTARRQGDFALAADLLQTYAKKAAPNSDIDLEKQLCRVQQGNLAEADALLARCEALPDSPQTPLILEAVVEGSLKGLFLAVQRENAGQGEVSLADFTRAQRAVDQWLKSRPTQADQVQGYMWSGKLKSLARDYPKAEASFRKAIELDPDHFSARHLLAVMLAQQAPEEAAQHLELLHQRDPANATVSFLLATVRRDLGQHDQAGQLLDALLAQYPDRVPFLVERGRVALDQRLPREAERWLRRAAALAPNHAQANLFLSQSLQQTDREAEAKVFHDRFLQIKCQMPRQDDTVKKKDPATK